MRPLLKVLALSLFATFCLTSNSLAKVTTRTHGVAVAAQADTVSQAITFHNSIDAVVNYQLSLQSVGGQGRRDGLTGPRRDARGGPDDQDYQWRDSDEEDGPVYDWIDITQFEDVTDIQANDDDSLYGMFDLPFDFPFYGHAYNQIAIGANGYATFLWSDLFPYIQTWQDLPNANPGDARSTPPRALLAVNYQDLNLENNGHIYMWGSRSTLIVTWDDVPQFNAPDGDRWTFQLILTRDGFIKYQYRTIGAYDNGPYIVIGLQNEERDRGFNVIRRNNEYLEAEKAIGFGPAGSWINWVMVNPAGGEIGAGGETDITLNFIPGDHEDGVYQAILNVTTDDGEPSLRLPLLMSLNSPVGNIAGTITDAATREPISDAAVVTELGYTRWTDEQGQYRMDNLPVGNYRLTCSADGFNSQIGHSVVQDGQTADGSLALRHGEFTPEPNRVQRQLAPNSTQDVTVTVTNGGNDPVHYRGEMRLIGDANAEPWTVRQSINVGELVHDQRIDGAVFAEDNYYLAGAHGNNRPMIYVLSREGAYVDSFPQVGTARTGHKDLEYDGEWIWGSADTAVYAFDLDGNRTAHFHAPYNPTNNIAWDTDRNCLWVSSITQDYVAYDRAGNRLEHTIQRKGLRVYGLSYFPEDRDGHPLYVLDNPSAGVYNIHKVRPADSDTLLVHTFAFDGSSGVISLSITNQLDVYSWVALLMATYAGNPGYDQLKVIQVDARRGWLTINPSEGDLAAGGSQDITFHLDATDLPEAQFRCEIVFTHNGRGGETIIPVQLDVVAGPVHAERTVEMIRGWNLISANVQPDEVDVSRLLTGLVQNGDLVMIKDGAGHFYHPGHNFDDMSDWTVTAGYQVKVSRACSLTLSGMTVMPDDPIHLRRGWQIAPYYPRVAVDAEAALAGLGQTLMIAKDGYGNFYVPRLGFNAIGAMSEGQGYQMRLSEDADLVYQGFNQQQSAPEPHPRPVHFAAVATGAENMSLLLTGCREGVEYAAYSGNLLVGSGVAEDGLCGMPVWGDDPTTLDVDGAMEGAPLRVVRWDGSEEGSVSLDLAGTNLEYRTDDLIIAAVAVETTLPTTLAIASVYPNPFNSRTTINYSLPQAGAVQLVVFDMAGRQVAVIATGSLKAGTHTATLDGSNLSSGIYILKLKAGSVTASTKIVLAK